MFTDVIYTNITYFKLQVSVPLSLIYHLWSYYNNSAIYNANKSLLLPLFIRKGNLIFFIFARKDSFISCNPTRKVCHNKTHQETIVSFPDPFQIKAFDRALLALL